MFRFSYLQIVGFLNHAANKQVYFETCITSPKSGSKWHRVVEVGTAKILFDTQF